MRSRMRTRVDDPRSQNRDPGHPSVHCALFTDHYLSVNASTPGSFLPSKNSRLAPPPVLMWGIWSATPAWLMAETESPPPMMGMAPLLAATAWAMSLVKTAKLGTSKTPAVPFQTMVLALATIFSIARMDLGP